MTTNTSTRNYFALTILLLAATGPAFAQAPNTAPAQPVPGKEHHGFEFPKVGVDVGLFIPSDGKTRSRFGKTWTSIGVGIGRPDKPSGAGRFGFDFSTILESSGDHHAFIAPLGVSYRRAFNADDVLNGRPLIPYYGVSADVVVLDLRSPEDDVHSRFRLTGGGSAVVGTTIGASGFAEAKYLAVGKVKGFDLSGFNLAVGVRF